MIIFSVPFATELTSPYLYGYGQDITVYELQHNYKISKLGTERFILLKYNEILKCFLRNLSIYRDAVSNYSFIISMEATRLK